MKLKNGKKPLSLKNDYVFRSIMSRSSNRDALVDFLKSAIVLPADDYEEITVIDPHLLAQREDDKEGILDVRIRTKTGKQLDIEIQLCEMTAFGNRIVHYNARMCAEQLSSGQDYDKLGRAISVIVTDFSVVREDKKYYHRFDFSDLETGIRFSDVQEICLFELPKLPNESDGTVLWDWLRLIKTENVREMEMLAKKNPHIEKVVNTVWEMSEDEAERMIAEAKEKTRRDERARLDFSLKKGLAQGLAEGKAETQLEVARNMKVDGTEVALIEKWTGLSEAEIAKL